MPKPRADLTAAFIKTATAGEHWDAQVPGFGLRVSPKGKRVFYVRYRIRGGKQRREALGEFPHVSLADARSRARQRIGDVAKGLDPFAPSRRQSFKAVATRALEVMAESTRPRTVQERQRVLDRELLPRWADRAATDIRRGDVATLAREIAERGAPVAANRTLSLVRAIFNVAIDLELVDANPASRSDRFMRDEKSREIGLSKAQLGKVMKAVSAEGPEARAFFLLCLYTAQRAGALAAACWTEFVVEDALWTIPSEARRKLKGYARLVPLTAPALGALDTLRAEAPAGSRYLFPSRNGATVPHWTSWAGVPRRIRERSGVPGWSMHTMRAMFRTTATRDLGVPAEVADGVLGHTLTSVGHVHYQADKSGFMLKEKWDALSRWAGYLQAAQEA